MNEKSSSFPAPPLLSEPRPPPAINALLAGSGAGPGRRVHPNSGRRGSSLRCPFGENCLFTRIDRFGGRRLNSQNQHLTLKWQRKERGREGGREGEKPQLPFKYPPATLHR